mgnify:CR=1 FL=1
MSKNFYITTPIYYPSAKPHMGHAYSSIVADFFARLKKIQGFDVFFLTGTDEHGQKIQRAAENEGKDPLKFCNEISKTFKDLSKTLNLSNNDFIRTTEYRHKKSVENLWNILEGKKEIYLSKYSGWYSVSDEAFYADDEIEEVNGSKICKISGSKVEWVEEESYFFKLSSWQDKLIKFYEDNKKFILPESRRNEVMQFVKKGLKDLSISRTSFSWGIPVPKNNKHVIYVWLDALTNYISALNYPNTNDKLYKSYWPATVHLIGKDILRFHAVYWPAFLLAANIDPPKRVYGHGWILSGEEKMSKSKGNILDPIEIVETYGLDPLRYYLIKEVSFGNDGNISKEKLENCINSDLANNYGNLCQRVFSFIEKNCSNKIPKPKKLTKEDKDLIKSLTNNVETLIDDINNQELNSYLKKIINYSFNANKYFNDTKPWELKKTNTNRMEEVLFTISEQIKNISILLNPIIPIATTKTLNTLNIPNEKRNIKNIKNMDLFDHQKKLHKSEILFKKVENDS